MQSSPPSTVHDSPMTPSGDDARHVERRNPPARTRRASRVSRANTSASRVRAIANAGRVNSSSRRALDMDRTPSADDLMASFLWRTARVALFIARVPNPRVSFRFVRANLFVSHTLAIGFVDDAIFVSIHRS